VNAFEGRRSTWERSQETDGCSSTEILVFRQLRDEIQARSPAGRSEAGIVSNGFNARLHQIMLPARSWRSSFAENRWLAKLPMALRKVDRTPEARSPSQELDRLQEKPSLTVAPLPTAPPSGVARSSRSVRP
jgi:hypothetical protein